MAEFQMESGGGGQPPTRKRGLKIDKTLIYVIGAVVIVVFLLFRGRSNNTQEEAATYITDGYPDNDVDYDSKLSNFENIMTGQVDASMNQFTADLNSELNQMKLDIGEANKELLDKQAADYQKKLDAINKQNAQLSAQIKNLASTPAQKNTTSSVVKKSSTSAVKKVSTSAVKKVSTSAVKKPASSGPKWLSSLIKKSYSKPAGGWNSNTSIVDRLKSKGYAGDFNSRKKLAAAMGISGYSGSATQNIKMLKNMKAAGL